MKHIPKDFDEDNYYKLNPDVKISGLDAKQHFLKFGIYEGRRWFNTPKSNEAFLINSGYVYNDEFARIGLCRWLAVAYKDISLK